MKVAPSILAADFRNLGAEIERVNAAADIIHLDIMDGSLVPNISFGFPVVEAVAKVAQKPLDAHLMVVHPERWFEKLAGCGVSMVSFHLEAAGRSTAKYLAQVRALGMKAGLAIDPDVPVEKLYRYIGKADYFLIMSVFAGFGGQKFIYESLDRVAALKAEIQRRGNDALVQTDGGAFIGNAAALREAGVDIVVAGSAVFGAEDAGAAIEAMRRA